MFEGLTDDGKYYVIAEMPTNVGFLPAQSPDEFGEFEGYKIKDLYNPNKKRQEKRHKNYLASITNRLDVLSPDDYQPSLRHLEEIISSLKIEK